MSIVRLDERFMHSMWRGVAYHGAWHWIIARIGTCTETYRLEADGRDIATGESGQFSVAVCECSTQGARRCWA